MCWSSAKVNAGIRSPCFAAAKVSSSSSAARAAPHPGGHENGAHDQGSGSGSDRADPLPGRRAGRRAGGAYRFRGRVMSLPRRVRIVDVGPRDGLQNEARSVPTAVKIELISRLAEAGLPAGGATAVVSPQWGPQIGDHAEVMARLEEKTGVAYPRLVPN